MYADGRELLVFRTFSQSGSVPKKFFDTLREPYGSLSLFPASRMYKSGYGSPASSQSFRL